MDSEVTVKIKDNAVFAVVYNEPNIYSGTVGRLNSGTTATATQREGEFMLVKTSDLTGWITASKCEAADGQNLDSSTKNYFFSSNTSKPQYSITINTTSMNLRTGAGASFSIVSTNPKYVSEGQTVYAYKITNDWAQISHSGEKSGYAYFNTKSNGKLICTITSLDKTSTATKTTTTTKSSTSSSETDSIGSAVPKYKGTVVTTSINIRTGPGKSYSSYASLNMSPAYTYKGEVWDVYELIDNSKWAKVYDSVNKRWAYIATKRLIGVPPQVTYLQLTAINQSEKKTLANTSTESTTSSSQTTTKPTTPSESASTGELSNSNKWFEYYGNSSGKAIEGSYDNGAKSITNLTQLTKTTNSTSSTPLRDSITSSGSTADSQQYKADLAAMESYKKLINIHAPKLVQNDYNFPTISETGVNNGNKVSPYTYNYGMNYYDSDSNGGIGSTSSGTSTFETVMQSLRKSLNIPTTTSYYDTFKKQIDYYNRFKVPTWNDQLSKSFGHIFFVKPDLNISSSGNSGSAYFTDGKASQDLAISDIVKTNPLLLNQLTQDDDGEVHRLGLYLSNKARTIEISDEELDTAEYGATATGFKMGYGRHNLKSKQLGKVNINYVDDRNLSVFKLHKVWLDYISGCYRGIYTPKDDYFLNHSLDYAAAIYYILTAEDGETIIFWSKFYGVYPLNLPSSTFSKGDDKIIDTPEISISYNYTIKEDLNPIALSELNSESSILQKSDGNDYYVKSYDASTGTSPTWVGVPFVEKVTNSKSGNGLTYYKLRFRTV